MALAIVRPAPFVDLLEMAAQDDLPPAARKRGLNPQTIARTKTMRGRSWGLFDGARCVACLGLFPSPSMREGVPCFEAWFFARAEAARHMLGITRLAQLTASATWEGGTVDLFALVAEGHRPGERLAVAIGCRKQAVEGGFGVWIYEG